MPGSPKWSLSLRFPHRKPVHASLLPHTRYMPHSLILLVFIIRTVLGEVYRSLSSLLCIFIHSHVTLSFLGLNILLNTLFSKTLSLRSSLNMSNQVSYPHKTTGKILVLFILNFQFLDSKLEEKKILHRMIASIP